MSLLLVCYNLFFLFLCIVEGQVYDRTGHPLANVHVSYIDSHGYFSTFTDSTGYYRFQVHMSDGMHFTQIRSPDQIQRCQEYMNMVSQRIAFQNTVPLREHVEQNVYPRTATLSFQKLGYQITLIDTMLTCRMAERAIPRNRISPVYMLIDSTDIGWKMNTRRYFTQRIMYSNIEYWYAYHDIKYFTREGGFPLLDALDKQAITPRLLQEGKRVKRFANLGGYSRITGLALGVIGGVLSPKSSRIYPITLGLVTIASGWYRDELSYGLKMEFIQHYNCELTNRARGERQ